ncbi:MAG: hypothetical protein HFJ03_09825 [Lachnospira sp.]|nr:hypothetical protein [Lachnospira sp.]
MNSESNENAIIQNLKDAGCNQDMITAFINDLKEGYIDDGMKLLAAHRRLLLEELHREQKQIDCLDYLVYKMKKTKKVKA